MQVGRSQARIGLAGQIPASTLFQCWRVRIVLFAHRVTGLPGCWVAVIFNHPSAWVADRHDRLRPACRTAPQTSVTWPTQRLSPGRHNDDADHRHDLHAHTSAELEEYLAESEPNTDGRPPDYQLGNLTEPCRHRV